MTNDARNRIANLRNGAPDKLTNGQALHGQDVPQIQPVDFTVLASQVLNRLSPQFPTPYMKAPGEDAVVVNMPDYSQMELQYRAHLEKNHADGSPFTTIEEDKLAMVLLLKEFQQKQHAFALHWNARRRADADAAKAMTPAPEDKLPEAPTEDRAPEGFQPRLVDESPEEDYPAAP